MSFYYVARSFALRGLLVLAALATCREAAAYSFLQLAAFSGGADGAAPLAGLAIDAVGNLYGTTSAGGSKGAGTVFKIAPGPSLKTLYTFCSLPGCTDGAGPHAGAMIDKLGNLYGTTNGGGSHGNGAVFEITGGKERVLYSFCPKIVGGVCPDGALPVAGLIMNKGKLYGMTPMGGANDVGVVFELSFDPAKGIWDETVLYSFCRKSGCVDGSTPLGGLVVDPAGNLYGTTQLGGAHGAGVVFEVEPSLRSESVLYSFCKQSSCADGQESFAGLTIDKTGTLYGTTPFGGNNRHAGTGGGVVFTLARGRTERVLYAFCSRTIPVNCADGIEPQAALLLDAAGNFYGTTSGGGTGGQGAVFRLTGPTESVLHSFCSHSGCGKLPVAPVVMDKLGNLYGTTRQGGSGFGTVYELRK